jgi:hypothetical protein
MRAGDAKSPFRSLAGAGDPTTAGHFLGFAGKRSPFGPENGLTQSPTARAAAIIGLLFWRVRRIGGIFGESPSSRRQER